jgi:hypothetical protein
VSWRSPPGGLLFFNKFYMRKKLFLYLPINAFPKLTAVRESPVRDFAYAACEFRFDIFD